MAKYKIMHFVYDLTDGGVESVLLSYFSNFDNKQYELVLVTQNITSDNCYKKFAQNDFKIYKVSAKSQNIFKSFSEIKAIIKKEQPNIIHSHMNESNFWPLFIGKLCRVKIRISHSHSVKNNNSLIKKLYRKLNLLVSTNYMSCGRDAGMKLFGKNNIDKVYVLNNAIDIDKYKFDLIKRKNKRQELEIDEDTLLIGNVGRFVLQKNHEFLLKIFANYKNINENSKLLLIGTGNLKEKIICMSKELNIYKDIIFLENRNDMNELYMAMDCFIMPSLFEGLPVSGIEAQITGVQCLFSSVITDECKVIDNTKFISLDENIDNWISEIKKISNDERKNCSEKVKNTKFDIKCEKNKLKNYYLNLLEGENYE